MSEVHSEPPRLLPAEEARPQTGSESLSHIPPSERYLLERASTQWQFGDWQKLAQLGEDVYRGHPDRAKLALLVAAGNLQLGRDEKARGCIQLAREWGADKRLVAQVLISGVYNSLGRAVAVGKQSRRSLLYFGSAIRLGTPGVDQDLVLRSRVSEQLRQLDLMNVNDAVKPPQGSVAPEIGTPPGSLPVNKTPKGVSAFSSARYWDRRYQRGGNSGNGSYGRLAVFKAEVINLFVKEKSIKSIVEFGCGDGNQLAMFVVDRYLGVDVSQSAIEKCRTLFSVDHAKNFMTNESFTSDPQCADLSISLDVIYHLVEDAVFDSYMRTLFRSADKYCIIYSSDRDDIYDPCQHVRRRKFTEWVSMHIDGWRLSRILRNKYPHDGPFIDPEDKSHCDFYFYERTQGVHMVRPGESETRNAP